MKEKIFCSFVVLAIAVLAAININLSSNKDRLSDVSLANVEALARAETDKELTAIGCEVSWKNEMCCCNNGVCYCYARYVY